MGEWKLRKICKCGKPCRDKWCIECSNSRNAIAAGKRWRKAHGAIPERAVGYSQAILSHLSQSAPQYWEHTATKLNEMDYGGIVNNGKIPKASTLE